MASFIVLSPQGFLGGLDLGKAATILSLCVCPLQAAFLINGGTYLRYHEHSILLDDYESDLFQMLNL